MDITDLVGYLVGALGLIVGAYGVLLTRQAPARLRYGLRRGSVSGYEPDSRVSMTFIGGNLVDLTFDGRPVPRVSALTAAFVNAGRQRVNQDDTERPVTLTFPETVKILSVSGHAAAIDDHSVTFNLCPLAPGERRGATVHHTGPQNVPVTLSGEIKNLPRGIEAKRHFGPWHWVGIVLGSLEVAMATSIILDGHSTGWMLVLRVAYGVVALPSLILGFVVVLAAVVEISAFLSHYLPPGSVRQRLLRRSPFPLTKAQAQALARRENEAGHRSPLGELRQELRSSLRERRRQREISNRKVGATTKVVVTRQAD